MPHKDGLCNKDGLDPQLAQTVLQNISPDLFPHCTILPSSSSERFVPTPSSHPLHVRSYPIFYFPDFFLRLYHSLSPLLVSPGCNPTSPFPDPAQTYLQPFTWSSQFSDFFVLRTPNPKERNPRIQTQKENWI